MSFLKIVSINLREIETEDLIPEVGSSVKSIPQDFSVLATKSAKYKWLLNATNDCEYGSCVGRVL